MEGFNDLFEEGKLNNMPNVKIIAIPDKFISVAGNKKEIRQVAGLNLDFDQVFSNENNYKKIWV
ncbi:MAG: hypothetical protein KAW56_04560 [Candidatus Marinimicrobia bacterium]|nr:hypothetical protein [Candidatus Neomarinimicrobiota bacterium]